MTATARKDISVMFRTTTLLIAVAAGVCASAASAERPKANRSLYSYNQPVVERTDFIMDLSAGGNDLSASERARLADWLDSLSVGYGDRLFVENGAGEGARDDVARVASEYGLLLHEGAPVTAGAVQPGTRAGDRQPQHRQRARVPELLEDDRLGLDLGQLRLRGQFEPCRHDRRSVGPGARPDRQRPDRRGHRVEGHQGLPRGEADRNRRPREHRHEGGEVMNAPFHGSRAAALRDPFAAFVSDDSTAELLRPIAVEHGWAPEKVNRGGLRNAIQTLSVSASPMILFVDLSESGDPLNDINALAEVCEPGTVVIAAGQVNDVRLYRDLIASGIQDYLLKPFTPDQLRDSFAHAQLIVSGPRVSEQTTDKPHVMTAVIGVRGGVGASTLASSLAWLMGDKGGRSTALLDLDVHFGTGALALDLEPGRGLTDAIENPSRIDGLFIERAMVRANEKLCVLSAEAPLNQPMLNDGTAYFQLQDEIRNAFEATVLDLPRSMIIQHPHLVQDVHAVLVVVEFTLAATRDAIRISAG
jgi:pilus assembly protein CpaE